jgi:hypothetical protein
MSQNDSPRDLIAEVRQHFPTEIRTPAEHVTESTLRQDNALARTNDIANHEAARLQEQAKQLLEQAAKVEFEAHIRQRIRDAKLTFRPSVHQNYFVYDQAGQTQLTLIAPEEWNDACPYGQCLARVRQLGDLTWEVHPM